MPYNSDEDEDDHSRGRRRRRNGDSEDEEDNLFASLNSNYDDDDDDSGRHTRRRRSGSSDSENDGGSGKRQKPREVYGQHSAPFDKTSGRQDPRYEPRGYDTRGELRGYYNNDNNVRAGGWEGGRGNRNDTRRASESHWQDRRHRPIPNQPPMGVPNRLPVSSIQASSMHGGHIRPPQIGPPSYPPPPPPPAIPPPVNPQQTSSWSLASAGPPRPPLPPQPMNPLNPYPPPAHQGPHNPSLMNSRTVNPQYPSPEGRKGIDNHRGDRSDGYHRGGERSQTCRLTQVSQSVTEDDVRKHFLAVGVGMVASIEKDTSDKGNNFDQRSLLVQFYSVEESEKAVRCLKAVCDNRFIQVKRCPYNIVDPGTLPPPPPLPYDEGGSYNNGKKAFAGKGQGKGKGARNQFVEEASIPEKSGEEQLKEKLQKAKELAAKEAEIKDQRRATLQKQLDETMAMKKRTSAQTPKSMVKMLDDRISKLQGLLAAGLEVQAPVVEQAPLPGPMKIDNRTTTIFVGGLPPDCNEDTLLDHFSAYGVLENAELLEEPPYSALIRFKSRSGAEKAFKLAKSFGGLPLNFSWYTPPRISSVDLPSAQD